MNDLNKLGLRLAFLVIGGGAVVFGLIWGIHSWVTRPAATLSDSTQPSATTTVQPAYDDTDADGLPDLFENIYRTNPNNADSDNDGTDDFTELSTGHDPTIAGPNDISKPPTGDAVTDEGTFTGQYLATLPTDASRDEVLNQTRLEAFVALHQGQLLTQLPAGSVIQNDQIGKAAIEAYLGAISTTKNQSLHNITSDDIAAALAAQLQNNMQPVTTIVSNLEANVATFKSVSVPAEVVALHTKLIQATQALRDNTVTLQHINDDFVGGLIASKNIDDLGTVFADIAQQVKDLEAKYGLE